MPELKRPRPRLRKVETDYDEPDYNNRTIRRDFQVEDATRIKLPWQGEAVACLMKCDEAAQTLRDVVDLELFEGEYREIAGRVYDYIDKYGQAPKSQDLGSVCR
jgi:hypothetical protein